ncbi:tautomerase family protein [Salinactinospora qingdaonensis]|uniref:4-oxalocrotonate tautomerase-like domain-containing protein n=1 Tax=Salinactinospora qingdaonensis TaxID=702744 RepID=A0ABP7FSR2_9ACTN
MPHVNIKHFPREFTEEQRQRLSEQITQLILDNFDTYEGAVSIALEPVAKADWKETVVGPEITERQHLLLKAPNYR